MNETAKSRVLTLLHKSSLIIHRMHHHQHQGTHRPGQARLLYMLGRMDGASQKDISREMGMRPASMSELIDKLEDNQLIERRQSPEDRRSAHIYLTERGREMVEQAKAARQKGLEDLLQNLTDEECEKLAVLLEKMVDGLEQHFHHDHNEHDDEEKRERRERGHGHGKHGHHRDHDTHDQLHDDDEEEGESRPRRHGRHEDGPVRHRHHKHHHHDSHNSHDHDEE